MFSLFLFIYCFFGPLDISDLDLKTVLKFDLITNYFVFAKQKKKKHQNLIKRRRKTFNGSSRIAFCGEY
jgi:hypothetical protein